MGEIDKDVNMKNEKTEKVKMDTEVFINRSAF